MTVPSRIVLVGGGLAAGKTAQALRKRGYEGALTLLTAEPHRPYERPPLSKGYLLGTSERDEVFVHDAGWYAQQEVDLRLATSVTGLDRERREVRTASGERLPYDAVLLATGAVPRRLPVPGTELDGVLTLRTLDDSEALRGRLTAGRRIVIIGGGWIGLEVAAAARAAGVDVTVVEAAPLPLLRALGPTIAPVFLGLHRDHGVDFRLGAGVEAVVGDAGGRVAGVRLAGGETLDADTVLVGVGVAPADGLAREAGLPVDNGVLVGPDLRTDDPAVFAAGDVANAYHPRLGRRVRVEHWANAVRQAPIAAAGMLGQAASYERLPYVFSDQYDLSMEYSGDVVDPLRARVVVRGSLEERRFMAFWLEDGRVAGGLRAGVPEKISAIEALVGADVDEARLADPDSPLEELAATSSTAGGARV
jgi:3-phenylpropionate/trans-cinnamate dioxygenase ferredoxin reductase subunit